MSAVKQHQEWLSLLEVSGPFIALPVLKKIFPHGLPKVESALKKELRLAYQDWQNSQEDPKLKTSYNTAWIRYVLKEVLGYPSELLLEGAALPGGYEAFVSEHQEKLQPDLAIVVPEGRKNEGRARILIASYPSNQSLDRALPKSKSKWAASPATRMMELLRRTSVEVGVVTNGEQWMLVHAPAGETTTFASWYANVWLEEEVTLQSFLALLSVPRIFGTSDDETLEALFKQSNEFQQEVSDQLGLQVRKAVELLIQALDRIDKDTGRSLLNAVSEKELYEAGVSVMMRLVFMLAAEERNLFPVNFEVYSANYAVSTLREQLQESAARCGEAVLEHRYDAWNRLLATFRLIYGGSRHEDLNSPAYGGSLFDPDKYPFLEGRQKGTNWYETEVDPLPINNRVVLHLLDSIQLLKGKGPKDEARKLSFRAIDVEQIGNVYESLLEHTAVRAKEPVLGLVGSKGKEPEVPLSVLRSKRKIGEQELVKWLAEETGKTEKTVSKLIYELDKYPDSKCLMVCDNDSLVYEAVKPFIGLVREDTLDLPVIVTPGSVYVTEGTERRSTGTHYTPRSLTEPIVEHTLAPVVYIGMKDGIAASPQTLLSPSEILELKVCDMTCGSGAFLVQACRYLADKLIEAWSKCEENLSDGQYLTIEGQTLSAEEKVDQKLLLSPSIDDRRLLAQRLIADRCIYGVDCNPMAAEMAKLSLWLTTLQRDRPFTFLDHAIKCGDSLVGATSLDQLLTFDLKSQSRTPRILTQYTSELVESACKKRIQLEKHVAGDICDTEVKEKLNQQAEEELHEGKLIADILVGVSILAGANETELKQRLDEYAMKVTSIFATTGDQSTRWQCFDSIRKVIAEELSERSVDLHNRSPLHWVLAFPEVFLRERQGFDAIVGNPPFLGGKRITGVLGDTYRDHLVKFLADDKRGSADLCAYFFLRAHQLLGKFASCGLVGTNTIAQGATREVGLDQLLNQGRSIYRAVQSCKWPAGAKLQVAYVWSIGGPWSGSYNLDGQQIDSPINSLLSTTGHAMGSPEKLTVNSRKSFVGSYVLGQGFVLTPEEAATLIKANPKNRDVVRPYLNGEDVNTSPDQSPSRWVLNFQDWPLKREELGSWVNSDSQSRQKWLKDGVVPLDYPDPVAQDYADCLRIVEERVRPERTRKNESGEYVLRYPLFKKWWIYADKRPALYNTIKALRPQRVLVRAITGAHHAFVFCRSDYVFDQTSPVYIFDTADYFAVLQSEIHRGWWLLYGPTMGYGAVPRYTPSDCFETFPFPADIKTLADLGDLYHAERQTIMLARSEGLTKIYNKFNDPNCKDKDILNLRELHRTLDNQVWEAYGWVSMDLEHNFYETKQGVRYTISPAARDNSIARLLILNRERSSAPATNTNGTQPLTYSNSTGQLILALDTHEDNSLPGTETDM